MEKFKVTREWIVEARDVEDAVERSHNWNHKRTRAEKYVEDEIK
jgi:hypothetical protein